MKDASQIVVQAAQDEWSRHVEEPPGRGSDRIDTYIRASASMAWAWLKKYVRNGQSSWCGAFAAHCFGVAGLSRSARKTYLPSTYRLDQWCQKNPARRVRPEDLRPGDIGVVGTRKGYGDHITIVVEVETTVHQTRIITIEGNGHGQFPNGTSGEGVIRRRRHLNEFRYGVRPLPTDYDQ